MNKDPYYRSRAGLKTRVALAAGAAVAIPAMLYGCASNGEQKPTSATAVSSTPNTTPETPTSQAPTAVETSQSPTVSVSVDTHPEIVDHRPAIALYSNNEGSLADGSLPFGTTVDVMCLAANESGEASIDPGFYKFQYNGQTDYAIANEFANGDPLGVSGYNTTHDPAVPAC